MVELLAQDELIEAFVARYPSAHTREINRLPVVQLARWAGERGIGHIALMEPALFDLYGSYLQGQRYKIRTLAQKQGVIRRFYEFLVSIGAISESPVPAGWVPVQPSRATREPILTLAQMESLIEYANDDDGRALISLGGLDGLKLIHVLQLTAADVSFGVGRAVVAYRRSDGRLHSLAVCAQSAAILRELIEKRPTGVLVLPGQAAENKGKAARRRIATAARRAGLAIRVSPRILEKSHRAALLAGGAPVHSVRERLGLTFSNSRYAETLLPPGADRRVAQLAAQAAHEVDALELLRQAESLCDQPEITPIAPIVIAGAALEMELRRMCSQSGLAAKREGIDAYSTVLYRKGLITRFVHSTLQAHGKLRNEAAHGTQSPDLSLANARLMIQGVALFVGGLADSTNRP